MLEVCGDGFGCHTIILYMSDIINIAACLKNHFVTNHFNFLLFDLNIDTEKHIVNLMTLTLCFCCVQQAVVFSLTDLGSVTPPTPATSATEPEPPCVIRFTRFAAY